MIVCPPRADEGYHRDDDDRGKCRLGDPVQRPSELVDRQDNECCCDQARKWRFDPALGVDCGSGHCSSHAHDGEGAIEEVGHAEVAQFLTGINDIVVLHAERTGNREMLQCCGDEGGNAPSCNLADECAALKFWRGYADRGYFADVEEKILGVSVLVDSIADAGEQDESDERSGDGKEPDDFALVRPFLTGLLECQQEDNATEAYTHCPRIASGQMAEDVTDDVCGATANVFFAQKIGHLAETNCDGGSRDEAIEYRVGDEVQKETEFQESQGHAPNAHHESNCR